MMLLYIASYFNTRDRLIPYVQRLETQGHSITSSWLNEAPRGNIRTTTTSRYTSCELQGFAVRDVLELQGTSELQGSDAIILDTFDETPRGGREVEWGAFIFGKVRFGYIVGPKRNVFHELATKQFDTWEQCIDYFKGITI